MPWGNFLVNLTSLRIDYTFSPRMTIRSLTQYNTGTHEISNNIRFNLIHRPGNDLFIVWNRGWQRLYLSPTERSFTPESELLAVKLRWTFRA